MERTSPRNSPRRNTYTVPPSGASQGASNSVQDASHKVAELLRAHNRDAVIELLELASSRELNLSPYPLDHQAMQILCDALRHPDCDVRRLTLALSESANHLFESLPFCRALSYLALTPSPPGSSATIVLDPSQTPGDALLQGMRERREREGRYLLGLEIPSTLYSDALAAEQNRQGELKVVNVATHSTGRQVLDRAPAAIAPHGFIDALPARPLSTTPLEFLASPESAKPGSHPQPIDPKPLPYSAVAVATDLKGTFSYGLLKRLTQAQQRDIVLTGESLSGKAAYYLRDLLFLDKNNFLQTLDLRRCDIAPAGYHDIFFALHQRSHSSKYSLNDLHLSGGALCRESLEDLQAALSQGCVKCLRLSDLDTAATDFLGPLVAQAHREGWKTEIWLNGECLYRGDVKRPFEDHYPGPALPKPPAHPAVDDLAEALVDKPNFKQERKSKAQATLVWRADKLSVDSAKNTLAVQVRDKGLDVLDLSNCRSFGSGKYAWSKNAFAILMKALEGRPREIPMTTLVLNAQSLSDADWEKLASSVKRGDMMRLELRNVGQGRKLLERANGLVTNAQKHSSRTWIDWS